MRKPILIITATVLLMLLASCQSIGDMFGSIQFVSPINGASTHIDVTKGPVFVPISIQSSYQEPKTVSLYLESNNGTVVKDGVDCLLAGTGKTTDCGQASLPAPGTYTIIAKMDSPSTSISASYAWLPYSAFDQFAMGLPGASGSPSAGFGIIFGAMLFIGVLAGIALGKGHPTVIILMVVLSLVALAAFFFSAGSAAGGTTIAMGIVAALILSILGWIIIRAIQESNKKSTMTTMYTGFGGTKFGRQITTADSQLLSDSINADEAIIQAALESETKTHQIPWGAIRRSLELKDGSSNSGEEDD